jgi:crotonobetainyl-CoA:carnitine CoA-transferase CaiB-like acyl-CoA transferase
MEPTAARLAFGSFGAREKLDEGRSSHLGQGRVFLTNSELPLTGIRVVDISTSYAGPTATMYLADLGADVIKVERPALGDDARAWGPPFVGRDSAWFHSANRNKRTIALDLRSSGGVAVLEQMLASSDVLVGNVTPTKLVNLGLDPDHVRSRHPGLVYCAISGFGLDGPHAHLSGYDLIAQARSGLMSVTGESGGVPQRVSTAMSDIVAGLFGALAIVAALYGRAQSGIGEVIDVSLLDSDLALMAPRIASYLAGEPEPRPSGGTDSVLAVYQAFATADRPIVVAIGNDMIWQRFCEVVGLSDLAVDPALSDNAGRRQARPRILPIIGDRLVRRTAADWLEALAKASVPASIIQSLSEVVDDSQVKARNSIRTFSVDDGPPIQLVSSPWRLMVGTGKPDLGRLVGPVGADTETVMREFGYSSAEIDALMQSGVFGGTPCEPSS